MANNNGFKWFGVGANPFDTEPNSIGTKKERPTKPNNHLIINIFFWPIRKKSNR